MSVFRFFAKEAQNDRVCGLIILNAVKDLALSTIKILRKRGSECQLLFLVGWLLRGTGWYGFHDAILFEHDDPAIAFSDIF